MSMQFSLSFFTSYGTAEAGKQVRGTSLYTTTPDSPVACLNHARVP